MAANNTEIEIKLPLSAEAFLALKEKLNSKAKFVKESHQIDDYYTPVHRNFVGGKLPFEWLSIRKRGGKTILNYKHFYPENEWITTHCDEYETEVQSAEQVEKILSALNFSKVCIVEKTRQVFVSSDFEIALDEVKDLGYFVEIEAMKDFGSVEETRKLLFDFAHSLGIDTSSPDARGYAYLMCIKNGMIREK